MRASSKELRSLLFKKVASKFVRCKKFYGQISITKVLKRYELGDNVVFDIFLNYCGVEEGLTPEFVDRFRYNWYSMWNEIDSCINCANFRDYSDGYLSLLLDHNKDDVIESCMLIWVITKEYNNVSYDLISCAITSDTVEEFTMSLLSYYTCIEGGGDTDAN